MARGRRRGRHRVHSAADRPMWIELVNRSVPRWGSGERVSQRWVTRLSIGAVAIVALVSLAPEAEAQNAPSATEQGAKLYQEKGCYGCHTMGKTGTPIAPDLSKIGAKRERAYLETWLRDPSAQRPTAHMPKIQMSEPEAKALAAYLSTLR